MQKHCGTLQTFYCCFCFLGRYFFPWAFNNSYELYFPYTSIYICVDEEHAVGVEYDVRTDEEYIDFSMAFQIF